MKFGNYTKLGITLLLIMGIFVNAGFAQKADSQKSPQEKAQAEFNKQVENLSAEACYEKAKHLAESFQVRLAMKYLNAAISKNKNLLKAYKLRANINIDFPEMVLADINFILKKEPDNTRYLSKRMRIYDRMGNYKKWLADAKQYAKIKPDSKSIAKKILDYYIQFGDLKKAARLAKEYNKKFPSPVESKIIEGKIYFWQGKYSKASSAYKKALRYAKKTGADLRTVLSIRKQYGFTCIMRKRFANARTEFKYLRKMQSENKIAKIGMLTYLLASKASKSKVKKALSDMNLKTLYPGVRLFAYILAKPKLPKKADEISSKATADFTEIKYFHGLLFARLSKKIDEKTFDAKAGEMKLSPEENALVKILKAQIALENKDRKTARKLLKKVMKSRFPDNMYLRAFAFAMLRNIPKK